MSQLSPGLELARDIFMMGVWTAQRVSDYNNIHKDDFKALVKNVMKEEPDSENPGQMRAWIEKEEVTYLNIRQQKTGTKVSIPCNSQLKAILEKYDYQMPHLEDQVINRYIKEVAQLAGLTDKVEVETTKGGTPKKEKKAKYTLIHTHTAIAPLWAGGMTGWESQLAPGLRESSKVQITPSCLTSITCIEGAS